MVPESCPLGKELSTAQGDACFSHSAQQLEGGLLSKWVTFHGLLHL